MRRKITYATACKIREYHTQTKATPAEIIKEFNLPISDSGVYAILVHRTYNQIKQRVNSKAKLTSTDVRSIKGLLRLGRSLEWLALKYNVSFSTIQRIKYGYTWTNVGASN